jgi:hypothetical protein
MQEGEGWEIMKYLIPILLLNLSVMGQPVDDDAIQSALIKHLIDTQTKIKADIDEIKAKVELLSKQPATETMAAAEIFNPSAQIVIDFAKAILHAERDQHLIEFWLKRDAKTVVWEDLMYECLSNQHYEDAAVYMSVLWSRQRDEKTTKPERGEGKLLDLPNKRKR